MNCTMSARPALRSCTSSARSVRAFQPAVSRRRTVAVSAAVAPSVVAAVSQQAIAYAVVLAGALRC